MKELLEIFNKFWKQSKTTQILTLMFMGGILLWEYWNPTRNKTNVQQTIQQTGNTQTSPNIITGDNSPVTLKQEIAQDKKINKQQIKIRVDRILEDAEGEIPHLKASFDIEFNKSMGKLNARGILYSGDRIEEENRLVNEFNTKINDLLLKAKRDIENILFEIGETNLGSVPYLSSQAKRYERIKAECSNTKGYFVGVVGQFESNIKNR